MSNNNKNIDDLAKDLLHGFETEAPAEAWDFIAADLKKGKKRALIIFYKWAASIAILLSVGTAYFYFADQSNDNISDNIEKGLIDRNVNQANSESKVDAVINQTDTKVTPQITNDSNPNSNIASVNSDNGQSIASSEKTQNPKEILNPNVKQKSDVEIDISKSTLHDTRLAFISPIHPGSFYISEIGSFEISNRLTEGNSFDVVLVDTEFLILQEQSIINSNLDKLNKDQIDKRYWAYGAALSPVYSFRNLYHNNSNETYQWGGGPENELNEQAIIAFSGGVDVEYVNDRFSISSGIYYSQLGQKTNDFAVNSFYDNSNSPNVYASNSIGNIMLVESDGVLIGGNLNDEGNYAPNMLDSEPVEISAKVHDSFEFVELPLIANYKIIDKKLDVGLVAGISTSILISSKTTITYHNQNLVLNDYNNLRKVNYNSVLGFGMQYPFNDRMRLKFQPVFKYSLNSLNQDFTVDYHPYSFAMYTGLSIDF